MLPLFLSRSSNPSASSNATSKKVNKKKYMLTYLAVFEKDFQNYLQCNFKQQEKNEYKI